MIRRLLANPNIRQFLRFVVVGTASTAVDWTIFFSLTSWSPWFANRPLIANALAFAGGFTNSYFFNRRWTFRSTDVQHVRQVGRFLLVTLVGLGLSELIVYWLLPFTGSRLLTKTFAVAVTLWWNFAGGRFWAFRKPPGNP